MKYYILGLDAGGQIRAEGDFCIKRTIIYLILKFTKNLITFMYSESR